MMSDGQPFGVIMKLCNNPRKARRFDKPAQYETWTATGSKTQQADGLTYLEEVSIQRRACSLTGGVTRDVVGGESQMI